MNFLAFMKYVQIITSNRIFSVQHSIEAIPTDLSTLKLEITLKNNQNLAIKRNNARITGSVNSIRRKRRSWHSQHLRQPKRVYEFSVKTIQNVKQDGRLRPAYFSRHYKDFN